MSSQDPSSADRKKEMNKARMRRYRAQNRRIDYVPQVDVLEIIERCMALAPHNTFGGVIDALIRRAHRAISGNVKK